MKLLLGAVPKAVPAPARVSGQEAVPATALVLEEGVPAEVEAERVLLPEVEAAIDL